MVFSWHIKSGHYCSSSQSQCTSWELGILITSDPCPGHFHMSTVINCSSGWMEGLITVLSTTLSTDDMTKGWYHRVTIQFPYTSALMNTPLLPPSGGGYSRAPLCRAWRMIQRLWSQKFDPLEVWSDTSRGCFVGFNRFLITPRDMNASSELCKCVCKLRIVSFYIKPVNFRKFALTCIFHSAQLVCAL